MRAAAVGAVRRPTATALAAIVGAEYCRADDRDRLLRAGGKSTLDLLRRKDSGVQDAPDAVLLPGDDDEVAAILRLLLAARHRRRPVRRRHQRRRRARPRSAATSRPWSRWTCAGSTSCTALDEVSGEAELGAGVTGPEAERLLGEHGFSLGHFPQSFEFATIGGFAATRSSGQDSAGYGRFDDMVRGLRVVTPAGVLDLGRAPAVGRRPGPAAAAHRLGGRRSASSPGCGCGCTPCPQTTRYEAWSFPDFATGAAALRAVAQTGTGPTVIRLSDEAETGVNLATTETHRRTAASPAAAWRSPCSRAPRSTPRAGTPRPGRCWRRTAARRSARRPARAWEHGRFGAPYLRDSLLAAGALCETLETATNWSNLAALKAAVTEALTDRAGRIRHAGAGAVPHFACVSHRRVAVLHRRRRAARQPDRAVARGQDRRVATRSCAPAPRSPTTTPSAPTTGRGCATRSASWASQVLRAVKATLDPAGILNPGKLIP